MALYEGYPKWWLDIPMYADPDKLPEELFHLLVEAGEVFVCRCGKVGYWKELRQRERCPECHRIPVTESLRTERKADYDESISNRVENFRWKHDLRGEEDLRWKRRNKTPPTEIGRSVQEIRKRLEVSQKKLAWLLNFSSTSVIQNLESGHTKSLTPASSKAFRDLCTLHPALGDLYSRFNRRGKPKDRNILTGLRVGVPWGKKRTQWGS